MASTIHWKSADLEALPNDEGTRYEIIAGELFVSTQPHFYHQYICGKLYWALESWSLQSGLGKTIFAPGLIFADDDDVVPDVAWLSNERLAASLAEDGKLHSAPDLTIEVLSPGRTNERRDREAKLALYSRRGVLEYWIVDWQMRSIEVYRQQNAQLTQSAIMVNGDMLASPLLPDFSVRVEDLFASLPLV